jgi:hypothetical protein
MSNSNPKIKVPPTLYKKFNPNNLDFSKLAEPKLGGGKQYISFPRYDDPKYGEQNVIIQTPFIKLSTYGIYPYNSEYHTKAGDRDFMKVPLSDNDPNVARFKKVLKLIDKRVLKKKKEIFSDMIPDKSEQKMYNYSPLVKSPPIVMGKKKKDDEKEFEKPEFVKVKFDVNYKTKEYETRVYILNSRDDDLDEDAEPEPVKNIEDMEKLVRLNCDVRMILLIGKLWASKTPIGSDFKFGLGIKVLGVEVVPSAGSRSGIRRQYQTRHAFVKDNDGDASGDDSDNESENEDAGEASGDSDNDEAEASGNDSDDEPAEASENDSDDEPVEASGNDSDEDAGEDSDAESEDESSKKKKKDKKKSKRSPKKEKKDKKKKKKKSKSSSA